MLFKSLFFDFTHRVARQRIDDPNGLGKLETRETFAHRRDKRLGVETGRGLDEGDGDSPRSAS